MVYHTVYVFYLMHRWLLNSILQIRECVYPIYTAQNVHFGWNEKVIGFVQSLKYYDSIVKKEAEKGIAAYSFSASFIYTY